MDALKSKRINWFLYFSVCSVQLLPFTVGMALGWLSPAIPVFRKAGPGDFLPQPITAAQESWLMSLLGLGAGCAPPFTGVFIERFGRKMALIVCAVLLTMCYLATAFAPSVEYLLAARFMMGVACSFVFTALPMYVGEIAEPSKRGAFVCLVGTIATAGMLTMYAIATAASLQLCTIMCAVPVILFLLTFGIFATESPFHHVNHGRTQEAVASLNKLRLDKGSIEKELVDIENYVHDCKSQKGGFREVINSRRATKGLIICTGAMVFQQFSGFTAVISAMQSILDASNSTIPSNIGSIVIAGANFIVHSVTVHLADRLGRKILLIISSAGATICLLSLGTFFYLKDHGFDTQPLYWLPVASLSGLMMTYGLGLGPLPLTISAELFPANVKALCTIITAMTCALLGFLICAVYPSAKETFGLAGIFYFFGACGAVGVLFFSYLLPETKGKTFDEIQIMLGAD